VVSAANAAQRDANLQEIIVTIKFNGVIATTLDGYKAK
jgi:hypothetical protein